MKTFKSFVSELYNVPVVSVEKKHNDLDKEETINELNLNLKKVLSASFSGLEEGIHKIKKVLSMYSIIPGEFDTNNSESAKFTVPLSQKSTSGENFSDVTAPFREKQNTHYLSVSYTISPEGNYKISAKVSKQ